MAVMTSKFFSMPMGMQLMGAMRRLSRGSRVSAGLPDCIARPSPMQHDEMSADQSRYARLLERELDRDFLTEVEREDSEMLDRVRAALYAED